MFARELIVSFEVCFPARMTGGLEAVLNSMEMDRGCDVLAPSRRQATDYLGAAQ